MYITLAALFSVLFSFCDEWLLFYILALGIKMLNAGLDSSAEQSLKHLCKYSEVN